MKDKDFKDLLTSIDQAREIHIGKLKPSRVFEFDLSKNGKQHDKQDKRIN